MAQGAPSKACTGGVRHLHSARRQRWWWGRTAVILPDNDASKTDTLSDKPVSTCTILTDGYSLFQLEVHSVESIYLDNCLSMPQNHALLLRQSPQYQYVHRIFPDVINYTVVVHTLWEKGIRFRHPDYDPDRAQKLISSSMSQHLSTRNTSSKSMHAFLSNLACGQKHIPPPLSEVITRDLRSFEIRFESDVQIRFESDRPIRKFRIAAPATFAIVQ